MKNEKRRNDEKTMDMNGRRVERSQDKKPFPILKNRNIIGLVPTHSEMRRTPKIMNAHTLIRVLNIETARY